MNLLIWGGGDNPSIRHGQKVDNIIDILLFETTIVTEETEEKFKRTVSFHPSIKVTRMLSEALTLIVLGSGA